MKNTITRKTFSIILSLLLILTMLPISAVTSFATDENVITDQASLQTALNNGGEYVLGNDIVLTNSVDQYNDVTTGY